MKYIIIILLLSAYFQVNAQPVTAVSRENELQQFMQRLKKELTLTDMQASQILDLRREELRVLDSIQHVQKTKGTRFNPRTFIEAYDNKMKALLTPEQLEKLETINKKRRDAVEQKIRKS